MERKLNTTEEAIEEFRKGNIIIVVDDEDRENEGDFITAADFITPEKVNFMAMHGRGLICAPVSDEICKNLELDMMVSRNTSSHETQFTVSVDLLGDGCTTGISASDRSKTIKALANAKTTPEELGRPGHIFPLRAKAGGVLRRTGHTEATVDLAILAGLTPAGALVEIMNEDGTMARLPDLFKIADKFNLKIFSIKDLIAYRIKTESLIEKEDTVDLPTEWGNFKLTLFKERNSNQFHLALAKGTWKADEPVLVRVHSSCVTGDIFGSCRCDCGTQLHKAMELIEKEGKGLVIYMNQEGRGIGLDNKIKSYHLQELGFDTVEANEKLGFKADERDYGVGAQIIREMNVHKIKLMTNNPKKLSGLMGYGMEITETIPIIIPPNEHNQKYLKTKQERMGHRLNMTE